MNPFKLLKPRTGKKKPKGWDLALYRALQALTVRGDGKTVKVEHTPTGQVISAVQPAGTTPQFPVDFGTALLAKITTDHGDGTYDADQQRLDTAAADNFSDWSDDPITFDSGNNGVLREINGRAGVAVGTVVIVYRLDDTNGSSLYWYFDATSDQYGFQGTGNENGGAGTVGAWVEITGGSGSSYSWKQKAPDASADASPAVSGTSNLSEVNGREGIPTGSIAWAWYDGSGYQFEYHGADGGTEKDLKRTQATGASEMTNEFERDNQGTDRGMEVNLLTGIFADATNNKLYSYYRTIKCDANGHWEVSEAEASELVGCATFTCGGSGTPPSSGIHAHYPFEEGSGTTVADISGNGYDGTANGGMAWDSSPAVGSYAGDFDGSNDYVECPSGADPGPGSGDISVFAWIKGTADGWIVCASDGATNSQLDWALRITGGNVFCYFGVGSTQKSVTGGSVSSGWHSVGFVVTSGTAELWYDGVSQGTVSLGGSINNNGQPLGIGAFKSVATGSWTGHFTGSIDDVRIYDRALSNAEVAAIYNKTI